MSKTIIYSILFVIFFLALSVGMIFYQKTNEKPDPKTQTVSTDEKPKYKWGGTFYAALDWNIEDISAQMDFLQQNHISLIRADYVPLSSPDSQLSDMIMNAAKDRNIQVVLILQPEYIDYSKPDLNYTKIGTDIANEAIDRFGSQVDYYQLANEVGGTVYKTGDGQSVESYNLDKYVRLKDTITAMEATISQKDSTAKTIITNQWLHYGILDLLIKDGVSFDIIGWNWFPDGIDMDKVEYAPGKTINMLTKLKSYNKEVWLTEFNRDHGSVGTNGEQLQAAFLQTKLQKYYTSGVFSAIFIHQLFDSPTAKDPKDQKWGIIRVDAKNHTYIAKPALKVYTNFIQRY